MKKLRKGIRILITIALFGILLINVWFLIAQLMLRQDPPFLFGFSRLEVTSGSMEPAVSVGDLIIIHREKEYEIGDIVTYDGGKAFVTHRIVKKEDGKVITQGDANNVEDEAIDPGQIVGKVVFAIPGCGRLIDFLKSPAGIMLLCLGGFLMIEVPYLMEGRVREE
ncbi:signal peptidase I [Anaerolentibacter hominis]|uniref:signal peptidase I n=1 Tax=Anaerolentibacter hominis TaxID=3079009 RepID=UPI0031B7F69D